MTPKLPKKHCPLCGKDYEGFPALSRYDDKTEVCPDCGLVEAFGSPIILMCRDAGYPFKKYARLMLRNYSNPLVEAVMAANREAMKLFKRGELPGQGDIK